MPGTTPPRAPCRLCGFAHAGQSLAPSTCARPAPAPHIPTGPCACAAEEAKPNADAWDCPEHGEVFI